MPATSHDEADEVELAPLSAGPRLMREEEESGGLDESPLLANEDRPNGNGQYTNTHEPPYDSTLNRKTVRKLDFILLPFLALLFLLNSLDKSNVGNAETAGFTRDAGLSAADLNTSLAFFFAFFVALQPVGAALGRKYGMARWVPACMSLWGLCTILHIWVRRKWHLICLRIAVASLEAGFYPTTVSYLSLFYTRYEFAVRLGFFYGQSAVAGALGGVLSWAVFSRFADRPSGSPGAATDERGLVGEWRSWEVLFVIEGCTTMAVALLGFFWLPHSADSAWFFNAQERVWAEQRIRLDHDNVNTQQKRRASLALQRSVTEDDEVRRQQSDAQADEDDTEAHHGLLGSHAEPSSRHRRTSAVSALSLTADAGLSRQDILSAILNYKIWHLLICNILSAIPATAFGVFLPLVIKQLSPQLDLSPAASNLLSAPPFAFGAIVLFVFTAWSDRSHQRLVPILWGLGVLLIGLIMTVMAPMSDYSLRYASLCILLSGSFVASPLTVAWLSNNTPEPGKRAILLGINGWGNLAGILSALLFTPADESTGYVRPFIVTFICVVAAFAGFIAFWILLVRENKWREDVMKGWTEGEREREELRGDIVIRGRREFSEQVAEMLGIKSLLVRLGYDGVRRGDEKLTFRYGL